MPRAAILVAFALSSLCGYSAQASAAPALILASATNCAVVFQRNQARIEALVLAGRKAEIPALFTKAGCAGPAVKAPALPAGKAQKPRIKCVFKLLPPTITCTFLKVPETTPM
jgi:hypothetical protein